MYRLVILFMLLATAAAAQTKKPASPGAKKAADAARAKAIQDSIRQDSLSSVKQEDPIPKEFAVYTKRPKQKTERMKLCVNLVSPENILNHCINDSLLRDPEVSKVLFEKKQGDTTYVLVYVRAFSKPDDKPACDAGKEVKLFFFRWHTANNKAIIKIRTVESCMKAITNMANYNLDEWDRQSPLVFKYHKGAQNFMELKFDPQNYLVGFQSSGAEN